MPVFECSRCNDMTYSAYSGVPRSCAACGSETLRVIEGDFAGARRAARDLGPGDHVALVYDEPEGVAPFCARYVTDGVEAGERVVAAMPGDLNDTVRELLPARIAEGVEWHENDEIYDDFEPERACNVYRELLGADSQTTRFIAGPGNVDDVAPADFDRYERLAHAIVTAENATAVCLFDAGALPSGFLEVAALRHGLEVSDGEVRRNERFEYAPA